jgi:hypothetical protein
MGLVASVVLLPEKSVRRRSPAISEARARQRSRAGKKSPAALSFHEIIVDGGLRPAATD